LRSTKAIAFDAAFLKSPTRLARARIVTAQLFDQFFVAMNNAMTALYVRLAVESPSDVYSSTQKLKSLSLLRMIASCV
jgi:hypothetical protein